MRIYFSSVPVDGPWGGGNNFVKDMSTYLKVRGHEVVYDLQSNIDYIFMVDPRRGVYEKIQKSSAKVIHRVNECDKRKGSDFMDALILESNVIADETIFISQWLADYYREKGFTKKHHVIYNGCNTNNFAPRKKPPLCKPIKLVTHHWSDNWMKGFDIYNTLDKLMGGEGFQFTYIGRYNSQYVPQNIKILPPMHGKKLGDEIGKHDIYITASRFEPCGMHHIEGSACGLPVLYHEDGGGINELCKEHGLPFHDVPSLFRALGQLVAKYDDFVDKIDTDFLSSERACEQYMGVIDGIHNNS